MEGKELKKARYSTLRIGGERGGGGEAPLRSSLDRGGRRGLQTDGEKSLTTAALLYSVYIGKGIRLFFFSVAPLGGKQGGGEPCAALAFAPPHPLTCSSSTTTFPFFTLAFSYEGGVSHAAGRGEGKDGEKALGQKRRRSRGKARLDGSSSLEEEEEGAFWLLLFSRFSFPSALCTLSLTLPVRLEASTAACRGRRRRGTTCERHFPALLRF